VFRHVARAKSLTEARASLGRVRWGRGVEYVQAVYEECLRANLLGRLQVQAAFGLREEWVALPFEEAIRIFKARGLMSHGEYKRLDDAMRAKAWSIAGDHSAYTMAQVKDSLDQALAEGWSQKRWITETERAFHRWGVTGLGRHHLETVFTTNVLGAYQHGRWKQQTSPALARALPYWRYRTVGDKRVRDTHRAMEGTTARLDHPMWNDWYPPNGFRCRCAVEALSAREAEKGQVLGPESWPGDTGEALPLLPDEGFRTTPAAWLDPTRKQTADEAAIVGRSIPKPKAARRPTPAAKPMAPMCEGDLLKADVSKLAAQAQKDLGARLGEHGTDDWERVYVDLHGAEKKVQAEVARLKAAADIAQEHGDAYVSDRIRKQAWDLEAKVAAPLRARMGALRDLRYAFVDEKDAVVVAARRQWNPDIARAIERHLPGAPGRALAAQNYRMDVVSAVEIARLEPRASAAGLHFPGGARIVVKDGLTPGFFDDVVVHEVGHGVDQLTGNSLRKYVAGLPREVVTDYAKTNAGEDVAESVMLARTAPDELHKTAPRRAELMRRMFRSDSAFRRAVTILLQHGQGMLTRAQATRMLNLL
jgi:SPP1 gp7 family putative phage head morphogenesis protein